MGTFGDWFKRKTAAKHVEQPMVDRPKKKHKEKSVDQNALDKQIATAKGEPWVAVTGLEVDADRIGDGAFALDWNDIFVARLIKAGYKGKTDVQIVDMWFQDICRNVLLETYEQNQADPDNRNSAHK